MKKIFTLLALMLLSSAMAFAQKTLDIETIFRGTLNAKTIAGIRMMHSVEGYSQLSDDRRQVLAYLLPSGRQHKILADISLMPNDSVGRIDDYLLSPDEKKLLIQTNTEPIYRRSFRADFFVCEVASGQMHHLSSAGKQEAPVWSPDGRYVAFVRQNNIFVYDCENQTEEQITHDGLQNAIINGKPDWVYEEEFGFSVAMTFDAASHYLSWIRFDESEVETYDLQMFRGMKPSLEANRLYPSVYTYKYPKAGRQNSKVSVLTYNLQQKSIKTLHVGMPADGYLPRIKATTKPHQTVVYTLNRHQDSLSLVQVDLDKDMARTLLTETTRHYVKEEVLDQIFLGHETILLPSDRNGFMHLYLYNYNGQLLSCLIPGRFDITDVYAFNEPRRTVYYQAAAVAPYDRQVYQARFGGSVSRLTEREGWNSATFTATQSCFILQWSNRNEPYEYTVCNAEGKTLRTLQDNQELKSRLAEYRLPQRELFSFVTQDSVTLNGWMVRPADFDASTKYPVIMFQYSGPGSQQVVDSWNMGSLGRGALFDCYLAQQGFIVACVDGRGTGGRGSNFEKCTYLNLGRLEAHDQVQTLRYLARQTYVDSLRIGIWGWSYGGFNTLMSMSQPDAFFRAGVAIAPPADWRFYDSVYTERFMRTPAENPAGYDYNAIVLAPQLKGDLLLCHGLADDNVHPQNTFEYTEALVQADIPFKQQIYTNRNHSIYGGRTRLHLMHQIVDWFTTHLQ